MNTLRFPKKTSPVLAGTCLALLATHACATNGSYITGYGIQSASMGGASIALPQDAIAAANNPAGMAYVGNRLDVGMAVLNGYADTTFGSPGNPQSSHLVAPLPEMGVNYGLTPDTTIGVSVFGAGGKSNYGQPALPVSGAGVAKAFFMQVNVAPTVTYRMSPTLAVGASLVGGYAQFRADGLIGSTSSGEPVAVPSHGTATAFGYGAGLGALWKPMPALSLGANYYTKMRYGRLQGYDRDLLASDGGTIDAPRRYGLGVAFGPLSGVTLALDWLRIDWSSVPALSDRASFGWHNQDVLRIGVSFELGTRWKLIAGYSHANSHLDTAHLLANYYVPAVLSRALTLGVTYRIDAANDVSVGYEHDIPRTLVGTGASAGTTMKVGYDFFRIAYAHRF
ncbi:OmpP1/FadL family transporter [Ralstonia solanacearum]|uniref:OmpP1/FadL family transporter n=1 Tax=Ralstonia solanacearum TaxID=305 RepID=UPI00078D43CE|nr:outer membrane protein transport protein [Ralstonia solanacearum]AMP38076.1 hypothetical protein LBM2029_11295 [Ralstonia solanacearum]AXV86902.1 hypothetical protein CJO78_11660 [Ralstonia solanacearum]AXW06399.1 hypothetical protein CJO82_11435 [Ralstonia solanacearum]AXW24143.1 hypothetical protein CJO86_11440 [Ralstonia solanacearum]AXW81077.1 hypothetical protein CJO98_11670 [Ralstonia solanacearum]